MQLSAHAEAEESEAKKKKKKDTFSVGLRLGFGGWVEAFWGDAYKP